MEEAGMPREIYDTSGWFANNKIGCRFPSATSRSSREIILVSRRS